MKHVAFINENTLGHASYLEPFVRALRERPELGIEPHLLHATPLPPELERRANFTVRGLRRWGLDFNAARWRVAVSRHVRCQIETLRAGQKLEAVVVNTQSVALALEEIAREVPVFVCLDATFEQLARSAWFAPNPTSRLFQPLTLATIRSRERRLFQVAERLLPWSMAARNSLITDYDVMPEKCCLLPPSLEVPARRPAPTAPGKPQILFVGGDFQRKGGPLVLECFRRRFAARCELHIVTQSEVPMQPGVFVHRGIRAQTEAWRERWEQADVFVFPSRLETFGIVLLEALAFGVPVISADAGAAREVLSDGAAGVILPSVDEATLGGAVADALENRGAALARVEAGRRRVEEFYSLAKNTARLAGLVSTGR